MVDKNQVHLSFFSFADAPSRRSIGGQKEQVV